MIFCSDMVHYIDQRKNYLLIRQKACLSSLVGREIISVSRQLFLDDFNLKDYEQTADGPLQMVLDDCRVVHFFAMPTEMSVGVRAGEMPLLGDSYKHTDPSDNEFWQTRLNQSIQNVNILQSAYARDDEQDTFGIEISLENNQSFCVEYLSTEEQQDTLRIVEKCKGNYIKHEVE